MRYLLLLIMLVSGTAYGQSSFYIRADSTRIIKNGGNNELILENGTRNVPGVLVNKGNGRTEFSRVRSSGDTLFIGRDTVLLDIPAPVGQRFGEEDIIADRDRYFDLDSWGLHIDNAADFVVTSAGVDPGEIQVATQRVRLYSQKGSTVENMIELADTIRIHPAAGGLVIDSLGITTDTTNYKILVWNDADGSVREYTGGWPSGGSGSGVTAMQPIGASPNANGATISGSDLTLQPASASFGGVVTTGTQTFAGEKTLTAAGGGGSYGLKVFNTNVGSNAILIGFQNSTNDAGEISYAHVGTNNTANSMNLAMKGAAFFPVSIYGTGNVGIGGTTASEKLQLNGNFRISGALMPNNTAGATDEVLKGAGASTANTWYKLISGFGTPTATDISNVDASIPGEEHYQRVGNIVTVTGTIEIDATAANTATEVHLSFPIASAISSQTQGSGLITSQTSATTASTGYILASIANDRAILTITPQTTSNTIYSYTYSYRVL